MSFKTVSTATLLLCANCVLYLPSLLLLLQSCSVLSGNLGKPLGRAAFSTQSHNFSGWKSPNWASTTSFYMFLDYTPWHRHTHTQTNHDDTDRHTQTHHDDTDTHTDTSRFHRQTDTHKHITMTQTHTNTSRWQTHTNTSRCPRHTQTHRDDTDRHTHTNTSRWHRHTHTNTHAKTILKEWSGCRRGRYVHNSTKARDKHPCSQRVSNPRSQQ